MKFKVKFFEERFVEAIGAGVYSISLSKGNKEELLYIGESVFVLVRCATHLYEIAKGTGYLGFSKEYIEDDSVTIIFRLLEEESSKQGRITHENEYIKRMNPIMQTGIKDRVKPVEDMINEMTILLNNN